jgi:hypothetical protein
MPRCISTSSMASAVFTRRRRKRSSSRAKVQMMFQGPDRQSPLR